MRTTTRRCLAVLGSAMVAVTLAVSPGHGAEDKTGPEGTDPITEPVPGDFRSWEEVFASQEQLNAAADTITDARDTSKDDGFSGMTAVPEDRKVVVYWRGPVPPRVLDAVEAARKTAPVTVAQSRYSEQELVDRSLAIQDEQAVTSTGPNADGSGLTVEVSVSEEEARKLPAIKAATVPVGIVPFVSAEAVFNRQDDIPPYWGGARWSSPSGGCSTAFAVRVGTASAMLTAGHCGANGQNGFDGGGDFMGVLSNKNATRDIMLIRTSSAGRTYTGGLFAATSIPVKGAQRSYVGNYVCTSGSYTGMHCPIRVNKVNMTINTNVGKMYPMVRATRTINAPAVGHGDSGGPVISYRGRTTLAKGTISAGSTRLGPCGLSSGCYRTVYYADIRKTLDYYRISLITG